MSTGLPDAGDGDIGGISQLEDGVTGSGWVPEPIVIGVESECGSGVDTRGVVQTVRIPGAAAGDSELVHADRPCSGTIYSPVWSWDEGSGVLNGEIEAEDAGDGAEGDRAIGLNVSGSISGDNVDDGSVFDIREDLIVGEVRTGDVNGGSEGRGRPLEGSRVESIERICCEEQTTFELVRLVGREESVERFSASGVMEGVFQRVAHLQTPESKRKVGLIETECKKGRLVHRREC